MQKMASVAQVGGFRPPSTPRSSWMCSVLLGAPGESWPRSGERPMWPLCQVLVEELPAAAPAPLAEVALLTLFIDLIRLPHESANGDGWQLRTYATTDGLVPLIEPDREASEHDVRPFPVIWRPRLELPSRDDTPFELLDLRDELDERDTAGELSNLGGLKIGGWPETVQSEVDWWLAGKGRVDDAEFVLQVDSDETAHLWIADSGVIYLGWSPRAGWLLTWQSY